MTIEEIRERMKQERFDVTIISIPSEAEKLTGVNVGGGVCVVTEESLYLLLSNNLRFADPQRLITKGWEILHFSSQREFLAKILALLGSEGKKGEIHLDLDPGVPRGVCEELTQFVLRQDWRSTVTTRH